ncbi:uncharacterized protein N7511_004217 [Penicillium nucicola]|uniref:uncharacterized protein n=1 Tax=Penicillium nucicola TaxID=1850975 RepID=UPI002545431E|nr:uncharacterized protein N7511_004217 [Penicillium nucicola]KAJ5766601.1 hypothetical protein N7511_004217 [Penicillium nucicola]
METAEFNINRNNLTPFNPTISASIQCRITRTLELTSSTISHTSKPILQDQNEHPTPPATHRKRALPQGELEAASTLKLGADQHTHTLSLSEARLVIHKVLENKRRGGNKYEEPENLTKTLDYLDVFARFKDEENIKAVERLLNSHTELEMFERSQLGSLCCDNAEEAKSLIPSLQNKISDGDLQELLDELTKLRNFTE